MDREPAGVRHLIENLTAEALRDLLRNVRHHTDLQRRIAAGQISEREANAAYVEYARRRGPEYRRKVADMTVRYYADLAELGNTYSDDFYAELLGDTRFGPGPDIAQPDAAVPGDAAVERVPIEVHGVPGKEVVATFGMENTDDTPTTVSFQPGECIGAEGVPFTAPLTLQPSRATLGPGESLDVTIRLAMLPSVFLPGQLYRMPVHVTGDRNLELELTIWAEEPMPVAPFPSEEEPREDAKPGSSTSRSSGPPYLVECPECRRRFERKQPSTRLYRHKTPEGEECPARDGIEA